MKLDHKEASRVKYTNSSAVSAGEIIYVAGMGALVASANYGANVEGVYYTAGVVTLPIASGVTINQGNRCYWDVSENKVILATTAAFTAGDFFIGTAVAAGTAAGGYVDVAINWMPTIAAPSYVVVGYGAVASNAGTGGTITVSGAQTTDKCMATLLSGWTSSTVGGASILQCNVSAEDTVTYVIGGTGISGTSGGIGVEVLRAV